MVHTSDEIAYKRGSKKNKIKGKENNYFLIKLALHSLKYPSVNCPEWSVKVLDKLNYRLMENAAVALYSKKTDNSNMAAKTWARSLRQKKRQKVI